MAGASELSQGFIGSGDAFMTKFKDGTDELGETQGPYKVKKFSLKPNSENKDLESRGMDDYGQLLDSVTLQKPFDFSMVLARTSAQEFSMGFMGEVSAIQEPSGTIAESDALDIKIPAAGTVFVKKPDGKNIRNWETVVIKSEDGQTTFEAGKDYRFDYLFGRIIPIDGGALPTGEIVKVSGKHNAVGGSVIEGGKKTNTRVKVDFIGKNRAGKKLPYAIEIYDVVLTPDQEVDLLSDDFLELTLNGRMRTPDGMDSPFKFEILETAA